jgi:copper resistance protein C
MRKRKSAASGLIALLAATVPSAALAHAFPDHAVPAVGSTIAKAPAQVRIWFTERLEPAFSKVEVRNAKGERVDLGDAKVDERDQTLIRVSLKRLSAGTYKVVWHAVSVDTHATDGDFSFMIEG